MKEQLGRFVDTYVMYCINDTLINCITSFIVPFICYCYIYCGLLFIGVFITFYLLQSEFEQNILSERQ